MAELQVEVFTRKAVRDRWVAIAVIRSDINMSGEVAWSLLSLVDGNWERRPFLGEVVDVSGRLRVLREYSRPIVYAVESSPGASWRRLGSALLEVDELTLADALDAGPDSRGCGVYLDIIILKRTGGIPLKEVIHPDEVDSGALAGEVVSFDLPERGMSVEELFGHLDACRLGGELDCEALRSRLRDAGIDEALRFEVALRSALHELDTRRVAEACQELGPDRRPVSLDGFLYRRCGVIAAGEALYRAALEGREVPLDVEEREDLLFVVEGVLEDVSQVARVELLGDISVESCSNESGW